jgi:hypothetical protein
MTVSFRAILRGKSSPVPIGWCTDETACAPATQPPKYLILRRGKDSKKYQVHVAEILNVMRHGALDVSHVAFVEVHGTRVASGSKDGYATGALDVVLPFVFIRRPMQFA